MLIRLTVEGYMAGIRIRGEQIRHFILNRVGKSSEDVVRITSEQFNITRQAVNKHLQRLVESGALIRSGNTRARVYQLAPIVEWNCRWEIKPGLAEDIVWTREMQDILGYMPDNILDIWQYGFTEMFNNAIDHSDGSAINVYVKKCL